MDVGPEQVAQIALRLAVEVTSAPNASPPTYFGGANRRAQCYLFHGSKLLYMC
jgi:hypothetical protein